MSQRTSNFNSPKNALVKFRKNSVLHGQATAAKDWSPEFEKALQTTMSVVTI
jgi:hypothetical protein